MSAPATSRQRTTSSRPFLAATCKGVRPSLSAWSLSAPASSKQRITSECPCRAAECRGHTPSLSPCSGLAPASSKQRTTGRWLRAAAACSAEQPWTWSSMLGSRGSSSSCTTRSRNPPLAARNIPSEPSAKATYGRSTATYSAASQGLPGPSMLEPQTRLSCRKLRSCRRRATSCRSASRKQRWPARRSSCASHHWAKSWGVMTSRPLDKQTHAMADPSFGR
mmetsp:Transcript_6873/g.16293  ORF Transcript_6873/g.16293 Transcript_6873/m.16293 type:complete len:222 (-) Transcript_6873:19-684(-)